MNEKQNIIIGNTSTIITTISLMISGLIFGVISAYGLKLPTSEYELSAVIGFIIMTILAYINAKYHNTLFNKEEDTITVIIDGLSEHQITAIQNFVDNCTRINEEE